jgi:ribosome-associated protein
MRLDQFLKWKGLASTGGEAKFRIQRGDVQVNGSPETRRGRQLVVGDRIYLDGIESVVDEPPPQGGGSITP